MSTPVSKKPSNKKLRDQKSLLSLTSKLSMLTPQNDGQSLNKRLDSIRKQNALKRELRDQTNKRKK